MTAQGPTSTRDFAAIPDPAAEVTLRSRPPAQAPTEPAATRADRRLRGALALAASIGWIAAIVARLGLRADFMAADVLIEIGAWTIVGVAGLFVALRPSAGGLPRSLRAVQVVLLGVLLVFAVLAAALAGPPADSLQAAPCLALGALMAAGPMVLTAIFLQRSFISSPGWRGAAIGAICGLAGSVGIHAHCPRVAMSHVLLTHGLPILLGSIAGAVWSRARGRI